jgi:glutamine amidotransferase
MVFLSKVSCYLASPYNNYLTLLLFKLKDPHARSFTHLELRNAMMETLKYINELLKEADVVSCFALLRPRVSAHDILQTEPSLLNYVVTDGETVIATR